MPVSYTHLTKENVYTGLKTQGAVNSIINMVTQIICDHEIPLTDEIKAEAQSTMDSFKGYVGEENWDAFIKGNGYASEEDYFNQRVVLAARAGHITEKYLEEDWSNVISVYKPRPVSYTHLDVYKRQPAHFNKTIHFFNRIIEIKAGTDRSAGT